MLGDDDDGWGRRGFGGYPTLINREGPDVGRAQENGMARGVTWPNGCQTVEYLNHDGSITTYRTHGGMPQVTTNEIVVDAPVCIIEELTSPLTETSYAARTYHAEERFFSNNGIWSLPFKPIKSLTVTTGDAVPQTRNICLSSRSALASRTVETDLVEVSRDYTTSNVNQRVYIPGFFLQFSFEQILTKVYFQGKCGRPLTLKTYPTGPSTTSPHGSVFGDHVVYASTITNYRYTEYRARTNTTTNKFFITLSAPGKMFEEFEDATLTKLNSLVTPSPNAPFPAAERKVRAFGGSRGFVRNNGRLYTDTTFSTLVDAVTGYPAVVDLFNTPRYFRLTANADYTVPGTQMVFKGDVIFNGGPFPGLVFTGDFLNNHTLSPKHVHLFKTVAGEVWSIYVLITPGSGSTLTDNYKVYLGSRFDRITDRPARTATLLTQIDCKNFSKWSLFMLTASGVSTWVDPVNAASPEGAALIHAAGDMDPATWTGSPKARPNATAVVSSPDGKEAYVLGYYTANPSNADAQRAITSVVKLAFTETGVVDPVTGAGLSCSATEVPVVTEYLYTYSYSVTNPRNLHFPDRDRESTIVEDLGMCGGIMMHRTTHFDRAYTHEALAAAGHARLKTILWVYPRNDPLSVYPAENRQFDIVTSEFYRESAINRTYDVEDTVTYEYTDVCDNPTTWAYHQVLVTTPSYSSSTTNTASYDGRLSIVGSHSGVFGKASVTGSFDGADNTYNIEWGPSVSGFPPISLILRAGQTWFYPACLYDSVDYTPPNKLVRGQAVPVATQNSLVCVDVRNNSVYVAPTAADSGIFY